MPFTIAESFHVQAEPDAVWRYLIDPARVVQCLPGAELTEAKDERTFLGKVKIKVGPVVAAYGGTATLMEVDVAQRLVRLVAEGQESGGAGSARMTMTSQVAAAAGGGADVTVHADLDVAGKIVQFGRGMIDTVNKQLFRQFTECMRQTLEQSAEPALAPALAPADATRVAAAPPAARPLPIIPLVLRAIWSSIVRLFRGA